MLRENEYTEYCGKMGIINSLELTDKRFERTDWLAEGLLKPGLSILAGAPKIGKSWMVLQLCLAVAKGEPFMGIPTRRRSVLYITLEDSETRLQERINRLTEEASENLYIALSCSPLGEELARELADFCLLHSDAGLVVIDTFQKIREQSAQMSYSGDYAEISYLKRIADELHITILLVHHTRKMGDADVINEISGTTGIAGSADTLMILKKQKRSDSTALLSCTGRDIEDRLIGLSMDRETCVWTVTSGGGKKNSEPMPEILLKLIVYVGKIGEYTGSNTGFCDRFCAFSKENVTPSQLKRLMNRYRFDLEDAGVYFISVKKKSERVLAIRYSEADRPLPETAQEAAKWDNCADEEAALWDDCTDEEAAVWNNSCADREEIPLPTDDDAPPERTDAAWRCCS